jgi:hypothetical protein
MKTRHLALHAPVMISCSTPPNMYTSLSSEAVVGSAHVSGGRNGLPPPTVLEAWTEAADMNDGNPATGIQVGASGIEKSERAHACRTDRTRAALRRPHVRQAKVSHGKRQGVPALDEHVVGLEVPVDDTRLQLTISNQGKRSQQVIPTSTVAQAGPPNQLVGVESRSRCN